MQKKTIKNNKRSSGNNSKSLELSDADQALLESRAGLLQLVKCEDEDIRAALKYLQYERELRLLQIELVKLQRSIQATGKRVAVVFEGRDAAGKGGTIRRFIEHLNPRAARIVALPKPNEVEKGQWYFQRYVQRLPDPGELCFFDRSWYNRAVVEPVMGFCSPDQYRVFMQQVSEFEHMLYEDGLTLIKFWFSISKEEQEKRFERRRNNPLKQWKLSPVDQKAQDLWDEYTSYKDKMFSQTHHSFSPRIIVKANSKKLARLESIRYLLSRLDYEGKSAQSVSLEPDPTIVRRFHRGAKSID